MSCSHDNRRQCANCQADTETTVFWTGYGAARIARPLCASCVAILNHIGMGWQVERRTDPSRPDRDAAGIWMLLASV